MRKRGKKHAPTLADLGEEGFLRLLARRLPARSGVVVRGIGDDCAILAETGGGKSVLTVDLLVEGTHFTRETIGDARLLGRKAIAVNASDVAAMGGTPTVAVVGLGAPADTAESFLRELYRGMLEASKRYGCPIAGGDTVRSESLTLSIAMLGSLEGDAPAACRDAAAPGHIVYVTGWPGESGAGLALLTSEFKAKAQRLDKRVRARLIRRHQDPAARVEFGCFLRKALAGEGLAMVDVSDGVAHEAASIARASSVGIEIEAARLPISPSLRRLERETGADPLRFVLHGGEDYELLFTTSLNPEALAIRLKNAPVSLPIHAIGRVMRQTGLRLVAANGARQRLIPRSFEHFAGRRRKT